MEITSQELKNKINQGEKVLVDFYANWCRPCMMMKPTFEQVSKMLVEQKSNVQMYTFNIESDKAFVAELGIRSVPTIKGYSNGKESFTEIGMKDAKILNEMVNKL